MATLLPLVSWQAGGVDEETVERVRAAVRAIPPGETASYGEIAERTGLRSARLVGRILAEDGHDLPWHRVLRADGTCAPHLATEQSARLRAEGVLMVDGRLPRPRR
jgi:alkylated DNA nucleotide flippase Atl1